VLEALTFARCDGGDLAVTTEPACFAATKPLPLHWVGVTESQKSQWRSAEYCASVKVDRPGRSWISQAGASVLAV